MPECSEGLSFVHSCNSGACYCCQQGHPGVLHPNWIAFALIHALPNPQRMALTSCTGTLLHAATSIPHAQHWHALLRPYMCGRFASPLLACIVCRQGMNCEPTSTYRLERPPRPRWKHLCQPLLRQPSSASGPAAPH